MRVPIITQIVRAVLALVFWAPLPVMARFYSPQPDLTLEGSIAVLKADFNASHCYEETYNLGVTGLRGRIYIVLDNAGQQELVAAPSRQILVTVAEAPGNAVLEVDNLLLIAVVAKSGTMPTFANNYREAFGLAIDEAGKTGAGTFRVRRWRAGFVTDINILMAIMGDYTSKAAYNCSKFTLIFGNTRNKFASQLLAGPNFLTSSHGGAIKGLALLASVSLGDPNHAAVQNRLQTYACELTLANLILIGCDTLNWSYIGVFLCEYYLRAVADGVPDANVSSRINKHIVAQAREQVKYGTFSHGGAEQQADVSSHGSISWYSPPINAACVPANIAIVMGKKVLQSSGGKVDQGINPAIQRESKFFGYCVNKGQVPYGEHEQYAVAQASNSKNPMCAVLFGLQADRHDGTEYFARMSVGGCTGREYGHTGQGFSYLWGGIGANMGGQMAIARYMASFRWYTDLARRTGGSFTYEGQEQCSGGATIDNTYLEVIGYDDVSPTASTSSPTRSLSSAFASPASMINRDFINPHKYTITAAALSTQVFAANANYAGVDSIAFKANDGAMDSAVSTMNLIVTPLSFTWGMTTAGNWSDNTKWMSVMTPASSGLGGTAKLNLNFSGISQTTSLSIGGVSQAIGTYGSTSSLVVNKNDAWFSGTGMVAVGFASITNVTNSLNPAPFGTTMTLNSNVTGNVSFYAGITLLGLNALNGPFKASSTVNKLPVGNSTITVAYTGNTNTPANSFPAMNQGITGMPLGNWASDSAQGLTLGVNSSAMDDPSKDGVSNVIESVLETALMTASQALFPVITKFAGQLIFEYYLSSAAQSSISQKVEYGNNLTGGIALNLPVLSEAIVKIISGNPSDRARVAIPSQISQTFFRFKVTK